MEYKIAGDNCVLRLEPGEEIIACIEQVCAQENLRAGYVASAVGVLRAATVEIVLRRIPLELGRRVDQGTGLNLITFPSPCV